MSREENPRVNSWEDSKNAKITADDLTRSLLKSGDSFIGEIIRKLRVDKSHFPQSNPSEKPIDQSLSPDAKKIFSLASEESSEHGDETIEPYHLLLAITRWENRAGKGLLSEMGINYANAHIAVVSIKKGYERQAHINDYGYETCLGSDFSSPNPDPGKPE